MSVFCQE